MSFLSTSSKFLYNYKAISTSSAFSAFVLPNAYFFSLYCLKIIKNSSISLSYFASLYSRAGSFLVMGLNVFILISSSLNILTISLIESMALRKYVPCLCFISSVRIVNNWTATSGVIPYRILLFFRMATVASETIGASTCFKIDKELYILPDDQKWMIGFNWLIRLLITVSKVELSFIMAEINSICFNFYFWTPSVINCDKFMIDEFSIESGCMLFYNSLGPFSSKVSWIRFCKTIYLSMRSFSSF